MSQAHPSSYFSSVPVVHAYAVPLEAPNPPSSSSTHQTLYPNQGIPPPPPPPSAVAVVDGPYYYYQSTGYGGGGSEPQPWARDYDIAEGGGLKSSTSFSDEEDSPPPISDTERQLFLARVYGLLTFQLLVTTVVCLSFTLYEPLTSWAISSLRAAPTLTMLGFGGGGIVALLTLMCFRSVPVLNLLLLAAFTLLESCLLGVLCAAYQHAGLGVIVVEAAVLSTFGFLIMTLIALTTKSDLSCLGVSLGFILPPLMLWSLLNSFFPDSPFFRASSLLYASVSAAVFLLFTLYDTWSISTRFQPNEYVLATVTLYLDLVNLFVDVLRILAALAGNGGGGRDDD